MTSYFELRKLFTDFWKKNPPAGGHKEVPPIPLVPQNDPTTLFTGSGMQQLIPYLLGEPHPLGKRLFNIQPCFRSQDIEEVGDNRHTTFFEMMGNWSFGTYFKKEQITWFWEFLTKVLKLPKEKLYVSVFSGTRDIPEDKESIEVWKSLGVPEEKIFKYGPEKNWWSRAGLPDNMPPGEPGGPDSEVFYEFTQVKHNPKFGEKCHPNCECGRFMEIGNSVFMEYKKAPNGVFLPLPNKNVDFGGGLERLLAALNNNPDIFQTNVFLPIINVIENISDKNYNEESNKSAMRVIADHIKAATFLIKNGVIPSNKEQGYVLKRLLRRLTIKSRQLIGSLPAPKKITEISLSVINFYKDTHFDLTKDQKYIGDIIESEIKKFSQSLERGLHVVEKIDHIDGKVAFDLYQSYGFPLEITEELLKEKGKQINKQQFYQQFEKHKNLSRTASTGKFKGGLADQSEQTIKYHTATHLLHQVLFDILDNDIRQEGSNITSERLRFDFYSSKKLTPDEIKQVESIINDKIDQGLEVEFKIIPKEEALKIGAKSFFREKYPDMVKVYFIDNYSKEFCGGPHIKNTKEIGKITIFKFEKIGSNLYRIYAK